jgi:hypothetical protein
MLQCSPPKRLLIRLATYFSHKGQQCAQSRICSHGECICKNQSRAHHRIFGGDPMDLAKSIVAMCEDMQPLKLTSPETFDLQNDSLAGFGAILAAVAPLG